MRWTKVKRKRVTIKQELSVAHLLLPRKLTTLIQKPLKNVPNVKKSSHPRSYALPLLTPAFWNIL